MIQLFMIIKPRSRYAWKYILPDGTIIGSNNDQRIEWIHLKDYIGYQLKIIYLNSEDINDIFTVDMQNHQLASVNEVSIGYK